MIINIILILVIVGAFTFCSYKYVRSYNKNMEDVEEETDLDVDINTLVNDISKYFAEELRRRYDDQNLTRDELQKKTRQTTNLRKALTRASYGDSEAKVVVKSYIKDLISQDKYGINTENRGILPLHDPKRLNRKNDMFEILLYFYNKKYGKNGFSKLIEEFELTKPYYDKDTKEYRYAVPDKYIAKAYQIAILDQESSLGKFKITDNDRLEILTQRVYEKRFGFGAIDMLYDTPVDEIDVGVSGIPYGSFNARSQFKGKVPYSYESIWVVYHGLNLKMECLSFETQHELVRVTDNIYKYDAPYVMSRSEGRVVSTMIDGSRIVAVRPPFAESYAFFLRKFDSAPSVAPAALIHTAPLLRNDEPVIVNDKIVEDPTRYIPIVLMRWFIKGQRNIGITGSQGTGKTTMLKSMIRFIDPSFNLRIQELQFELNLRYTYPNRNIVTFQETANISAQEGLNLQKKTNGTVNIIGEVANAVQASHIIQTAMVASLFAMFTHHAKTAEDFVNAIADNLLQVGLYQDKKDAVRASAGILNIDCHLTNIKGNRHIDRITEIVPESDVLYPSEYEIEKKVEAYKKAHPDYRKEGEGQYILDEIHKSDPSLYQKSIEKDTPEFYHRMTDPKLFHTRDIMHWEPVEGEKDGRFVLDNMPSDAMLSEMKEKLSDDEQKAFEYDMEMIRAIAEGEVVEGEEEWIRRVLSY